MLFFIVAIKMFTYVVAIDNIRIISTVNTSNHVMLDFSIFPPQSKINSSLRSECSDLPIVLPIYDWSAG